MNTLNLSHEELQNRYDLLCKASQPNSKMNIKLQAELSALDTLITQDLVALTRKGCPENITDILKAFDNELTRFRAFCEFPELANKSIIGIGGSFSAGKSSFINKLIGQKCLVVEIDPTTSMPAYVLWGKEDSIQAINLHNCAITLSKEQFNSLTHEEKEKYDSQVGILLQSAFISLENFQWRNLAILDTPGYSKPEDSSWNERTDENIARSQLNTADYIVWVVSADNGTISEDDIAFLSSLDKSIPKLIVLSKADKKEPSDIPQIVKVIKATVEKRGIQVLDVVPYSRQKRANYPLDSIVKHFDLWNKDSNAILFAQNFKKQLLSYQSYVEEEQRQVNIRLHKINRILTLTDDNDINDDANDLLARVKQERNALNELKDALQLFNHDFFNKLKEIGNLAGVPLPEPNALELMNLKEINLLNMLRTLREERDIEEPVLIEFPSIHDDKVNPIMINRLLREAQKIWIEPDNNQGDKNINPLRLLREIPLPDHSLYSSNHIESDNHNLPLLLRQAKMNIDIKKQIYAI